MFFFFSSRRRHTRCSRDWSSDVCSSDLSTITASCRASASSNGQKKYSLRFPLNRTSTTEFNSFPAECAHRKVLLLAPFEELDDPQLVELGQVAAQRRAERLGRGVGVGVGAARGFGHDLVDDAELQQVLGRDLQRLVGAR